MLALSKGLIYVVLIAGAFYGVMYARSRVGPKRIPGTVAFRGKHGTVYISIWGSIVFSVLLSLLIYVLTRI